MGYARAEFIPSSIVSSSGATGGHAVPTVSMIAVSVNITAVTGTSTPSIDLYLEGSDDGGTKWYPIFYDKAGAATATAADVSAGTNKRNINGTSAATAVGAWMAEYKHVPPSMIRLRYVISGSFTAGQGFTLSSAWQGK